MELNIKINIILKSDFKTYKTMQKKLKSQQI